MLLVAEIVDPDAQVDPLDVQRDSDLGQLLLQRHRRGIHPVEAVDGGQVHLEAVLVTGFGHQLLRALDVLLLILQLVDRYAQVSCRPATMVSITVP